jgi:hypothetical protein
VKLTKINIEAQDVVTLTIELQAPELYRLEEMVEAAAVAADDYHRCQAAVEMNERLRKIEREAHGILNKARGAEEAGTIDKATGFFNNPQA